MTCGPFAVGQGSHTADCGYFCGYVVMLNSQPGGYRPGSITQADVYAERDAFRRERGLPPGHYFLSVRDMTDFLSFLGLPRFTLYANAATPRYPHTVDGFKQRVQDAAGRTGGVILLLEQQGQPGGHYIAVLGSQGEYLCCYDPANLARSGSHDANAFAQAFWEAATYLIEPPIG